jgi:hypothetical protein
MALKTKFQKIKTIHCVRCGRINHLTKDCKVRAPSRADRINAERLKKELNIT